MPEEKYPVAGIYDAASIGGLIKKALEESRAKETAAKAVALSLFFPGAGQVVSGRVITGLAFFFSYFAFSLLFFSSLGAAVLIWARFGGSGADIIPSALPGLAAFTIWLVNIADIILHNRKVPGAGLYLLITAEAVIALAGGIILMAAAS